MDNSLFSKYQKVIKDDEDRKQTIIDLIEENSGVKLNKEEISLIKKKEIKLFVSSAKKAKFHQLDLKKILGEAGYILN